MKAMRDGAMFELLSLAAGVPVDQALRKLTMKHAGEGTVRRMIRERDKALKLAREKEEAESIREESHEDE